jgi:hypothetical protein
MTFAFYIMVLWVIGFSTVTFATAIAICIASAVNDPMYKKLKTKGKIKYFILQLIDLEF